jgi:uncharacterized membrane protein
MRKIILFSSLLNRPRLSLGLLVGFLAYFLLVRYFRASQALLLSFDLGCLLFLGSLFALMLNATPQKMLQRARKQTDGQWTVLIFSLITIGTVMVALHDELLDSKSKMNWSVASAAASMVLSWLFLAVNFAQEYAHQYVIKSQQQDGGLLFPGTHEPDYWDFLYFSLVLSMACQTSDVQITSSHLRRLVLLHSVMAFFFNVVIIAITINVVASIL